MKKMKDDVLDKYISAGKLASAILRESAQEIRAGLVSSWN